uniref:Uncharacterized protein n=1 Tax=Panagrolaimus superbus TaxID=310955 RepID=A0A914XUZ2_9BILA
MATKCSMNLLLNNDLYTPNYGSIEDKRFKPTEIFTATENLQSRAVGDIEELRKVCFIQELRKCLHEHQCGIRAHSQVFGQIYDINKGVMSQIYHTAAFYVKEKWQQFKDFLFG